MCSPRCERGVRCGERLSFALLGFGGGVVGRPDGGGVPRRLRCTEGKIEVAGMATVFPFLTRHGVKVGESGADCCKVRWDMSVVRS